MEPTLEEIEKYANNLDCYVSPFTAREYLRFLLKENQKLDRQLKGILEILNKFFTGELMTEVINQIEEDYK